MSEAIVTTTALGPADTSEKAPERMPLSGPVLFWVALAASLLATGVAIGMWLWVNTTPMSGEQKANAHLEVTKTIATVVVMLGGLCALYLNARRQRTQELQHLHAVEVAKVNQLHAERVAAATEDDAARRRVTELYTKAVEQLGSEKAAVRLGGLYALERLAHGEAEQRQTVINVLCAYLRMPYAIPNRTELDEIEAQGSDPDRNDRGIKARERYETQQQEHEVRIAARRIIAVHLRPRLTDDSADSTNPRYWPERLSVDLTGAILVDADFTGCHFPDAVFDRARFHGNADFDGAHFNNAARFSGTKFSGASNFRSTQFSRQAIFTGATFYQTADFSEKTTLTNADFEDVTFRNRARFLSATFAQKTTFIDAIFKKGATFSDAKFDSGADFESTAFDGPAVFKRVTFGDSTSFERARFLSYVSFRGTKDPEYVNLSGSIAKIFPQQKRTDIHHIREYPVGWTQDPDELEDESTGERWSGFVRIDVDRFRSDMDKSSDGADVTDQDS